MDFDRSISMKSLKCPKVGGDDRPRHPQSEAIQMPEDLGLVIVEQNRQILAALTALRADVAAVKGELAGIARRFAAMDGRLARLQTT
jgi:hypothetical protein